MADIRRVVELFLLLALQAVPMVLADVVLPIQEEGHEGQMKLHQVRIVDRICLGLHG